MQTRMQGKAQRVARPVCANATVNFCRLAMLLPPSEWHVKTSTAYFSLCAVTTRANEKQVIMGYWAKIHQICSRSNNFVFHRRC